MIAVTVQVFCHPAAHGAAVAAFGPLGCDVKAHPQVPYPSVQIYDAGEYSPDLEEAELRYLAALERLGAVFAKPPAIEGQT